MPVKKKTTKTKRKTKAKVMTAVQRDNSYIFRLRGFYSNAKTLPFNDDELVQILGCVDDALTRLGADTQSSRI